MTANADRPAQGHRGFKMHRVLSPGMFFLVFHYYFVLLMVFRSNDCATSRLTPASIGPPTTANAGQHRPTTANAGRPAQGHRGLETRHVSSPGMFFFLVFLYYFVLLMIYRSNNRATSRLTPASINTGQHRPTTASRGIGGSRHNASRAQVFFFLQKYFI